PKPARWLFPDAPLALGDFGGKMWFPIDVEAIERAQSGGKSADFSAQAPAAMDEASDRVLAFLAELKVPWSRLILGGFSQGAMLAVDVALRAPQNPLGLAILSGNLIKKAAWSAAAPKRKGLRFFQSHGIADPILGLTGALALEAVLKDAGLV